MTVKAVEHRRPTQINVGHLAQSAILECPPDTPVAEAARLMHEYRHGSIIVTAFGEILGIWTERDALEMDFADPTLLDTPVSEYMSSPVKTISDTESIQALTFRFDTDGIRHLLVIDEFGNRVGVVSQTDVVNNQGIEFFVQMRDVGSVMRAAPQVFAGDTPLAALVESMRHTKQDAVVVDDNGRFGIFTETDALRLIGMRKTGIRAREAATFPLVSVSPQTSLYKARGVFAERQVRHLGIQDAGRLVGLITYRDILVSVEQAYVRELQQALGEQARELFSSRHTLTLAQKVAESSLQGIMITDANGFLESVNPAFTAITGYAPSEAIGRNPRLLKSGRHDPAFYQQMYATLARHGVWTGEIQNKRKNGEIYPAQVAITVVRGNNGEIVNYVGVFADLTEQRRAQEDLVQTKRQLEEQEDLNRLMLEALPINAFIKDADGRYLMVNERAAEFYGFTRNALVGRTDLDIFPIETAEELRADDRQVFQSGSALAREVCIRHRGTEHYLLVNKRVVTIRGTNILVGASVDITERKHIEQRLGDERRVLDMIARSHALPETLDTICIALERNLHGGLASILLLDEDGAHLRSGAAPGLSPAYMDLVDGIEIGPEVGSCGTAAFTRQPVVAEDILSDYRWAAFRELAARYELRACWSYPILDAEQRVLGTFAIYYRTPRRPTAHEQEVIANYTALAAIAIERTRWTDKLHRMATIDMLTGIPNRRHFMTLAAREAERVSRSHHPLTVCMIDVDRFKSVNDTYGHATGDAVLRQVAHLLAESIRTVDICGRLGGEEFAAVLPETGLNPARIVAERLREDIERASVTAAGSAVGVTVSIGLCELRPGETLEQAMSRADAALYTAKREGRNRVVCA